MDVTARREARQGDRKEAGREGEAVAARFLEGKGFRVLERNFRCRVGEIDLVCRDGDVLVFVEVRSVRRRHLADAAMSVTRAKQRQVVRTALAYLGLRRVGEVSARFDVVAVDLTERRLRHIAGAFDAGVLGHP